MASWRGTLLEYQDVGVLLLLHGHQLKITDVAVNMNQRSEGKSRIFYSWRVVAYYMAHTLILGASKRISFKAYKGPKVAASLSVIPLVTSAIGLSVALLIVLLIRNDRLHVTHGLGWLFAAVIMAGLGFAPAFFDNIATQLGVSYPPALAFCIGFAVIIIKLLIDDIRQSQLKMRQTRLVQRMAILETEVRRLKGQKVNRPIRTSCSRLHAPIIPDG